MRQSPANRILLLIKTEGPQLAATLGSKLDISSEAARQQLTKMAEDGLVEAVNESATGRGRPRQLWNLTAGCRQPDLSRWPCRTHRHDPEHAGRAVGDAGPGCRHFRPRSGYPQALPQGSRRCGYGVACAAACRHTHQRRIHGRQLGRGGRFAAACRKPLPDLCRRKRLCRFLPLRAGDLSRRPRRQGRARGTYPARRPPLRLSHHAALTGIGAGQESTKGNCFIDATRYA